MTVGTKVSGHAVVVQNGVEIRMKRVVMDVWGRSAVRATVVDIKSNRSSNT